MSVRFNLDLDTLRTLSVAHDLGSLTQAAKEQGRTPSAISLQMKRPKLEQPLSIMSVASSQSTTSFWIRCRV
jgi:hypothetical protein